MSASERLNDYLTETDTPADHYRIGDRGEPLQEADWACRKLAQLRDKQAEITRCGHAEIEKIKAWMAGEVVRFEQDCMFFEGLLIDWHQRQLAEAVDAAGDWSKVKQKTCRLPSGVITARLSPERVDITDEDAFFEAAPAELVRVRREPDKPAILAHIRQTGELLPGVVRMPGDVVFKVTVGSDSKRVAD